MKHPTSAQRGHLAQVIAFANAGGYLPELLVDDHRFTCSLRTLHDIEGDYDFHEYAVQHDGELIAIVHELDGEHFLFVHVPPAREQIKSVDAFIDDLLGDGDK